MNCLCGAQIKGLPQGYTSKDKFCFRDEDGVFEAEEQLKKLMGEEDPWITWTKCPSCSMAYVWICLERIN